MRTGILNHKVLPDLYNAIVDVVYLFNKGGNSDVLPISDFIFQFLYFF